MKILQLVPAVVALAGLASAVSAASIDYENFHYSGTVTSYDTLADAQNGTNGLATQITTVSNGSNATLTDARDAYISADTDTGRLQFGTLWYYNPQDSADPGTYGYGNPNNTNNGFVQLYDLTGSSVSSMSAGFNGDGTIFSFSASGGNLDEYSRLWNAPAAGGPASETAGEFLSYSLGFSAEFATPDASGIRTDDPTSVSGFFTALFLNDYDGKYYKAEFLFGNGSIAQQEDYFMPGYGTDFESSTYQAFIAPVPLPAGLPLLLVAVGGLGVMGRRKSRA